MYDKSYLEKFIELDKTETNGLLNRYRVGLVKRIRDYKNTDIIDIGCATGSFLGCARSENLNWGFAGIDVNPLAVAYTVNRGIRAFTPEMFDLVYRYIPGITCMTFFDAFEHLQDPRKFLDKYRPACVVVSIPCLDGFHKYMPGKDIQLWKHYRPQEHLWNFTADTFVEFMLNCGYILKIGPEYTESSFRKDPILKDLNIMSFAFVRVASLRLPFESE